MCAMMAGSALFSLSPHSRDDVGILLMAVVLVVSCCLSLAVILASEIWVFWAVCVIEACIGAYFPSMSYLKSEVVEDGVRGRVYSLLRMPLNVFVVVAHSLDQEGEKEPLSITPRRSAPGHTPPLVEAASADRNATTLGDDHRNHVFLTCAALLMVAFFVIRRNFST